MDPVQTLLDALVATYGPGWKVTRDGSIITATRRRSRLEYEIRFNGGAVAWFCTAARPWNIDCPDIRHTSTETP